MKIYRHLKQHDKNNKIILYIFWKYKKMYKIYILYKYKKILKYI